MQIIAVSGSMETQFGPLSNDIMKLSNGFMILMPFEIVLVKLYFNYYKFKFSNANDTMKLMQKQSYPTHLHLAESL